MAHFQTGVFGYKENILTLSLHLSKPLFPFSFYFLGAPKEKHPRGEQKRFQLLST